MVYLRIACGTGSSAWDLQLGSGSVHHLSTSANLKLNWFELTDWEKAKAQAECLDYLLEVAVKMRLAGIETEGLYSNNGK